MEDSLQVTSRRVGKEGRDLCHRVIDVDAP